MYLQIAFGHMSSQIMTMSNPVMQLEVYKTWPPVAIDESTACRGESVEV